MQHKNQQSELVVLKFGGTSVGSIDRIRNVANIVKSFTRNGRFPVVVVSAMSGVTDSLLSQCNNFLSSDYKEIDSIISSGEQVSSGLLALALQDLGVRARSVGAWKLGMVTDANHMFAKIDGINTEYIEALILQGVIPVVMGFQGLSNSQDPSVTTLGRGGSDTSAVAICAALNGASDCYIYTDVDGVYNADPRLVRGPKKMKSVDFVQMLDMAACGAKVLHPRSVELAYKYGVRVHVVSSFADSEGTVICDIKELDEMEEPLIKSIVCSKSDAEIVISGYVNSFENTQNILQELSKHDISVDNIFYTKYKADRTFGDMSFTVPKDKILFALKCIKSMYDVLEYDLVDYNDSSTKVSIIGIGVNTIVDKVLQVFSNHRVEARSLFASSTRVTFIIDESHADLIVRKLYNAFNLSK